MSPVPVVLLTGIDEDALSAAALAIQWDLPSAAAVTYTVDEQAGRLRRTISDRTGVVDDRHGSSARNCHSCAVRADLPETLCQLAEYERWESILVSMPPGAHADGTADAIDDRSPDEVRVSAVVAAVDGCTAVADLLGGGSDDRSASVSDCDERGIGEALVALLEYADAIVVTGDAGPGAVDLLDALRRPNSELLVGCSAFDGIALARAIRNSAAAHAWADPVRTTARTLDPDSRAWTIALGSTRPFHPERLLARLELLGGGPRRGRGQFWLPSRPKHRGVWDGIGGQLSIGIMGEWSTTTPSTQLVITGLGRGRDNVTDAFREALMTDHELTHEHARWRGRADGFEPWLGDLDHDAARRHYTSARTLDNG